jgi:hypothetical protein
MTPFSPALLALIPEHSPARAFGRFVRDAFGHAGIGALGLLAMAALDPGRVTVPATITLGIALWWGVCYVACRRAYDAGVRWLAQRSAGAA